MITATTEQVGGAVALWTRFQKAPALGAGRFICYTTEISGLLPQHLQRSLSSYLIRGHTNSADEKVSMNFTNQITINRQVHNVRAPQSVEQAISRPVFSLATCFCSWTNTETIIRKYNLDNALNQKITHKIKIDILCCSHNPAFPYWILR